MTIVNSLNGEKDQLYQTLDHHILALHNALLEKDFHSFVQAHKYLSLFESVLFKDDSLYDSKTFKLGSACEKEFFQYVESDFNKSGIRLEYLLENVIHFYYKEVKVATFYCGDSYVSFSPPTLLEMLSKYPETIVELETKLLQEPPKKNLIAILFFSKEIATYFEQEQSTIQLRIKELKKRQQKLATQRSILEESLEVVPLVFQALNIAVTPY